MKLDRTDYYNQLIDLHIKYCPSLRIGQFLTSFVLWHQINYGNDCFYVEDVELIKRIKEYLKAVLGKEVE